MHRRTLPAAAIAAAALIADRPARAEPETAVSLASWGSFHVGGSVEFAELVRRAGGSVDVVDLPERGIRGNSHMMMMDHNNLEVAGLIQDWLTAKGLWA